MHERESIVFVESNTTGTGEIFIKESLKMGYKVFFLSTDPFKYEFIDKYNMGILKIDTTDEEAMLQLLSEIKKLKLVFTSSEYYVETVNNLNKSLGLKSNNSNALSICRDKYKIYNKLENTGKYPKSAILNLSEKNQHLIDFPFVAKPRRGSGSVNVKLIRDNKDWARYSENVSYIENEILISEYVGGDEYSVEVFSEDSNHKVIGIVKKTIGSPPDFVEIGHKFPASIDSTTNDKIVQFVTEVLNDINYVNGVSHIEIKLDNNKIKLIEVNPRLAGGMIPILISECLGINLIRATLYLYLDRINDFYKEIDKNKDYSGEIKFILPEKNNSIIQKILIDEKVSDIGLKSFAKSFKNIGDRIIKKGDFSDRLVFILSIGKNSKLCSEQIKDIEKNIEISYKSYVDSNLNYVSKENTGRVKSYLHKYAKYNLESLSNDVNEVNEYSLISNIDVAHILMLDAEGIIDKKHVSKLLKEIYRLRKENFKPLIDNPSPRGYYFSYENNMIEMLGEEIGGNLQIGRSRNDINATINVLKSREKLIKLIRELLNLISSIILLSKSHLNTKFPIYSQYQLALTGEISHYLIGIGEMLFSQLEELVNQLVKSKVSPLGAVSGGGTTIPINPSMTAHLLGFDKPFLNSINAVSNRDLNINLGSLCSLISLGISRLAQDFQLWTTNEIAYISFPDELCGGSSAMPQKKNPYLIEHLKKLTDEIVSRKTIAELGILKTPFSNSYEVSSVSLNGTIFIVESLIKQIRLTKILINNMKVNKNNISNQLNKGFINSSEISELLFMQYKIPFRKSHHFLGSLVHEKMNEDEIIEAINLEYDIKLDKNDLQLIRREYGFGSGMNSIKYQIKSLEDLHTDKLTFFEEVVKDINKKDQDRNHQALSLIDEKG
jgi:argininosuccinate lyase